MRIASLARMTVIATPDPTEYNGKKSYKLTILQNGEAGSISCTEDAYRTLAPVNNQFVEVNAALEYNDTYKTLRVTGIRYPYAEAPQNATEAPQSHAEAPSPAASTPTNKPTK